MNQKCIALALRYFFEACRSLAADFFIMCGYRPPFFTCFTNFYFLYFGLLYTFGYFDDNEEYISPYQENPKDMHAVSFFPNGDVLNGNIYQKSISEILKTYSPEE